MVTFSLLLNKMQSSHHKLRSENSLLMFQLKTLSKSCPKVLLGAQQEHLSVHLRCQVKSVEFNVQMEFHWPSKQCPNFIHTHHKDKKNCASACNIQCRELPQVRIAVYTILTRVVEYPEKVFFSSSTKLYFVF